MSSLYLENNLKRCSQSSSYAWKLTGAPFLQETCANITTDVRVSRCGHPLNIASHSLTLGLSS